MDNFDLKKYLAEGKLNENLQIDDLFGEYVAQWSQGNYDYDFAELKPGPVKGSLVDDFTLGQDEYDDDDYARDYKMMRDYLSKNKSYELSQDEQEGLSQFPVQFSLEDDGETIKADIYYSPEYLAVVDADLAEGKLYENTINQISSRIVKLGKEDSIASEDIEEYIDDLKSSFEPDAYKNVTDEELLKDLRVASVFRNKKGSFRNQYSVGNASDIYDDFEVYYERWEDEFATGIDGRGRFDFDDEDTWNETNTPGDRVASHSWEIGYEEEDGYYEPIIYNMLNYLKKNKIYKYKNDDGIDAEFTLDDRGNSVDMVIYYNADDVEKYKPSKKSKLKEQLDLKGREYSAKELFALIARDLKFSSRVQDNEMLDADEAIEIMRNVIEIEGTESSPEDALGEYIANGEL